VLSQNMPFCHWDSIIVNKYVIMLCEILGDKKPWLQTFVIQIFKNGG